MKGQNRVNSLLDEAVTSGGASEGLLQGLKDAAAITKLPGSAEKTPIAAYSTA